VLTPRARRRRRFSAVRIGIGLVSTLVLVVAGAGWWTVHRLLHGLVGGITVSQALGTDDPRSSGGAMNILLIGLDSRKDQQGNDLPESLLDKLHAGDSDSGGYNTNTLILVHISADDKVTAFSIPRDDYIVATGIPGYSHIKIKEAYGLTKANAEQKLMNQGVTDQQTLETAGREAGRAATLRAVRNLTGAAIDYFAEVSLAGFYDLAESLGGVQVCLNHSVHDDYSGADFPAGLQTLDAEQALAFVRQRHGLDNGDLDRTHRQQAFLVSVMHQLRASGSFTDLAKMQALMAVARKDIVLSAGWGEEQFRRLGELASGSVEYRTLPVLRYENIDGEDVNIVDPDAIKAEVARAFDDAPDEGSDAPSTTTRTPSSTVDVVNESGTSGLADAVSRTLSERGYPTGQVRSLGHTETTTTAVEYGTGSQADAENIAALFGISTPVVANSAVAAGHIRVTLGPHYQLPDAFWQDDSDTTGTTYGPTPSATPTPDAGAPVDGHGIPCVN
jgi:LCP family protein required for cell wall assembly